MFRFYFCCSLTLLDFNGYIERIISETGYSNCVYFQETSRQKRSFPTNKRRQYAEATKFLIKAETTTKTHSFTVSRESPYHRAIGKQISNKITKIE